MNIFKAIFCKHREWDIQPTYILIHYDRCKNCGKLRPTIGKTSYSFTNTKFKNKLYDKK